LNKKFNFHVSRENGLKALDIGSMVLCFGIASLLVSSETEISRIRYFLDVRFSLGNIGLFSCFAVLWNIIFSSFGLYEGTLFLHPYRQAIDVVKATSIGTCIIVALAVPLAISFVNAEFLLLFWLGATTVSICGRFVIRELQIYFDKNQRNLRKILIIGANARSMRLAHRIQHDQRHGARVIGFVDNSTAHAPGFEKSGYRLVAQCKNLPTYLANTEIDEVLVCLPIKSRSEDISHIVSRCEEQGVAIGILRDLFKWNLAYSQIEQFGDQTIITVHPHGITGSRSIIKRTIDIVGSGVLISLFLPLFIITGLLIRLSSRGPILFSQERIGLNKRTFRMLKFRTMVSDAELLQVALEPLNEAAGPAFKIRDDPRITPLGKLLRKTSIDELPQLINVLQGKMSLVGPRPLPMRDYNGFEKDWHRRRISVRPGITGLWQINGRDHCSFDEWMELDLQYIDQWSLLLDWQVLLKTIPAVLRGSGE
jgi:exopolysaccharide biosynthesis polyprenyl glycosylphosphotransferase